VHSISHSGSSQAELYPTAAARTLPPLSESVGASPLPLRPSHSRRQPNHVRLCGCSDELDLEPCFLFRTSKDDGLERTKSTGHVCQFLQRQYSLPHYLPPPPTQHARTSPTPSRSNLWRNFLFTSPVRPSSPFDKALIQTMSEPLCTSHSRIDWQRVFTNF
jgi:hypothetical protein